MTVFFQRIAHVDASRCRSRMFQYDLARRLGDVIGGREGIEAKDGESNTRIAQRGFLRMVFRSRQTRAAYVTLVRRVCDKRVVIRLRRRAMRGRRMP